MTTQTSPMVFFGITDQHVGTEVSYPSDDIKVWKGLGGLRSEKTCDTVTLGCINCSTPRNPGPLEEGTSLFLAAFSVPPGSVLSTLKPLKG